MSNVYIGTSGWMYDHWKGIFYPNDLPKTRWLEYFSNHFKTVEINSTFYHLQKPETFAKWAKTVSANFIFTVKSSRFITHVKRLKDCDEPLESLGEGTLELRKKLGSILFQLPPRWKADSERLKEFFECWHKSHLGKKKTRIAFELRDPSWFIDSNYQILEKNNAALVIAESGGKWPTEEILTCDFVFLRFHGIGYSSKYSDDELRKWAKKIKKWQKQKLDVYVYFNNDVHGYAIENAKILLSML